MLGFLQLVLAHFEPSLHNSQLVVRAIFKHGRVLVIQLLQHSQVVMDALETILHQVSHLLGNELGFKLGDEHTLELRLVEVEQLHLLQHKLSKLLHVVPLLCKPALAELLACLRILSVVERDAAARRGLCILLHSVHTDFPRHRSCKELKDGATTGHRDKAPVGILDQLVPGGLCNQGLLGCNLILHSLLGPGNVHEVNDSTLPRAVVLTSQNLILFLFL